MKRRLHTRLIVAMGSLKGLGLAVAMLITTSVSGYAALGDSLEKLKEKYGEIMNVKESSDASNPEFGVYVFNSGDMRIAATMYHGRCLRIDYYTRDGSALAKTTIDSLLSENQLQSIPFERRLANQWEVRSGASYRSATLTSEDSMIFFTKEYLKEGFGSRSSKAKTESPRSEPPLERQRKQ